MKCKIIVCLLSLLSFVVTANAHFEISFSPDCPWVTTWPDIMPQWSIWLGDSFLIWVELKEWSAWTYVDYQHFALSFRTYHQCRTAFPIRWECHVGISEALWQHIQCICRDKDKSAWGVERPAENSLPWDNSSSREQSISLSPQAYWRSIPPVVWK